MIVDAHAHVYKTAKQGRRQKADYSIHEYGEHPVAFSEDDGTLTELAGQMSRTGVDRVFVVNMLAVRPGPTPGQLLAVSPGRDDGDPLSVDIDGARSWFQDMNRWCISLASEQPGVEPFIALDPMVLTEQGLRIHLTDCIDAGAKGVKLHALLQGFHASDERLWGAYALLQDAGLPVVAHSGTGRGERGRDAVPSAFAAVASAFPELKLVVAHLGGGAWYEAAALAAEHRQVVFDCCEIIHWLGAAGAPSEQEVVDLIHQIGADRVMLGSDFPWYGLDDSVNRILDLPGLAPWEQDLILGENALRLLPTT